MGAPRRTRDDTIGYIEFVPLAFVHSSSPTWLRSVDGTPVMPRAGSGDVGGTLMEKVLSRMPGSDHGAAETGPDVRDISAGAGRPVRERTSGHDVPFVQRVGAGR